LFAYQYNARPSFTKELEENPLVKYFPCKALEVSGHICANIWTFFHEKKEALYLTKYVISKG